MSVLIDRNTRLLVQGITGREGRFHAERMLEYGSNVVGGVTPGKAGATVCGLPVFDTVDTAVTQTGANATMIFVPPFAAMDAILEAADSGVELIVCITERIPVWDMVRVSRALEGRPVRLLGPNTPGIISPEEALAGIMPGGIFKKGPVGVISRSGTLMYEIANLLSSLGIGQSTCAGVGGDPVIGTKFREVLEMFESDPETELVVLVGEIGGSDEEEAAQYIEQMTKRVVSFISGRTAPKGKRMGHAGAIISGESGTAESKIDALRKAGSFVANTLSEIPKMVGYR